MPPSSVMMADKLVVRLFVRTQTYDIPCEPTWPAQFLLDQAREIQRKTTSEFEAKEQLEVLYNRTRRKIVEITDSIGNQVMAMDVIDARTLLQTPDITYNSAMFPWLRSNNAGRQLCEDKMKSTNGLFFQQLYAFGLIGKKLPPPSSQQKQQASRQAFLSLLESYVLGTYATSGNQATHNFPDANQCHNHQQQQNQQSSSRCNTCEFNQVNTFNNERGPSRSAPLSPALEASRPKIGSHNIISLMPNYGNATPVTSAVDKDRDSEIESLENQTLRMSLSPSAAASTPRIGGLTGSGDSSGNLRRLAAGIENQKNNMDVFDIVFKQQAIGMKLGSDDSKQFAVVKECFAGSEAKRYPEIQNGVVILAVNGQEVGGIGLSRVLFRLREAPRPVVVRFGRLPSPTNV